MKLPQNCYRVSAKAVIIKDNKILLTKEVEGWWSFPGGGIKHGELIEEALNRELNEELGVKIRTIDPTPLSVEFEKYKSVGDSGKDEKLQVFVRVTLDGDKINPTKEILDAKYFTKEEALKLTLTPMINLNKNKLLEKFFE